MALVSTADIQHTLIPETTPGTTPTASATRYLLPLSPDAPLLTAKATKIASPTRMPGRASNGSRRGAVEVDGSIEMRFQRSPVMDVLLSSALSGAFATNVLKNGTADSYFSILSYLQGGAAGSQMIKEYRGCTVVGMTLSSKANEGVMVTFELMGIDDQDLTTDNALTAAPTNYTEFISSEVGSGAWTIAGTTVSVSEWSLAIKTNRTRRYTQGSNVSLPFGVSGNVEPVLMVKAYRDSFAINSAITGAAQSVTWQIGSTGTGYSFNLPAAIGEKPTDELSDGSAFVNLVFNGAYDATSGAHTVITKL